MRLDPQDMDASGATVPLSQLGEQSALAEPSPFGHEAELAAALLALQSSRVVCLSGPVGVGLSHLTRALCSQLGSSANARPVYVELTSAQSPAALVSSLSLALGLRPHRKRSPVEQIFSVLKGERLVLAFDGPGAVSATGLAAVVLANAPHSFVVLAGPTGLTLEGAPLIQLRPLDASQGGQAQALLERLCHVTAGKLPGPGAAARAPTARVVETSLAAATEPYSTAQRAGVRQLGTTGPSATGAAGGFALQTSGLRRQIHPAATTLTALSHGLPAALRIAAGLLLDAELLEATLAAASPSQAEPGGAAGSPAVEGAAPSDEDQRHLDHAMSLEGLATQGQGGQLKAIAAEAQQTGSSTNRAGRSTAAEVGQTQERQPTLTAALLSALGADDANALRALSIFDGPIDGGAASAVAGVSVAKLTRWARLGLLRPDVGGWLMPAFVREAVRSHAPDRRHTQRVRGEHSRYFSQLLWQSERALAHVPSPELLAMLDAQLPNLRQAWRWSVMCGLHGECKAALEPLRRYFEVKGLPDEAAELIELWLERWQACDVGRAAYGRALAGLTGRMLYRAGLLDMRLGKAAEARSRVELARRLLLATGQGGEHALALGVAGLIDFAGHRYIDARCHLNAAARSLTQAGNASAAALAHNHLANLDHVQGRLLEAREHTRAAEQLLRDAGLRPSPPALLLTQGRVCIDLGEYRIARARLEMALKLAQRTADSWVVACAHIGLGVLSAHLGRFHEGNDHLEEAGTLHRRGGERWNLGPVLLHRALLSNLQGRPEDARRTSQRALIHGQEAHDPQLTAWAHCLLGRSLGALGDHDASLEQLTLGFQLVERVELRLLRVLILLELGQHAEQTRDLQAALRLTTLGADAAVDLRMPWLTSEAYIATAHQQLLLGDATAAREAARAGLQIGWRIGATSRVVSALVVQGLIERACGNQSDAEELLRRCLVHPALESRAAARSQQRPTAVQAHPPAGPAPDLTPWVRSVLRLNHIGEGATPLTPIASGPAQR